MITVVIPLPKILPTPNTIQRWHWSKVGRVRGEMRATAMILGQSMRHKHNLPPATSHRFVSLTLVRGKGQSIIDGDAVLMACKGTTDGLVDAHLMLDDKPKYLTWTKVTQERGPNPEAIYVITEEQHGNSTSQ